MHVYPMHKANYTNGHVVKHIDKAISCIDKTKSEHVNRKKKIKHLVNLEGVPICYGIIVFIYIYVFRSCFFTYFVFINV